MGARESIIQLLLILFPVAVLSLINWKGRR
jgi:hypothetical protein